MRWKSRRRGQRKMLRVDTILFIYIELGWIDVEYWTLDIGSGLAYIGIWIWI